MSVEAAMWGTGGPRTEGAEWGLHSSFSGWVTEAAYPFHWASLGVGRVFSLYLPSPYYPLIHQGEGSPTEGRIGNIGSQSLSEPTAEDPFRFRLVGFGFVSSSSEALLEPDSSSALGG